MFKRIILAFTILFASFQPVFAETEFITDYRVNYTVQPNGSTHAKFNISLTNKISNIYASEFSLSIGSPQLSQVKTYQDGQTFDPQVNQGSNTTNIVIPFPDKLLGKDKTRNFTLEFDSPDFANRMGNVWEISIPKLSQSENLNYYSLTLTIPQSFGQPTIVSPAPARQEKTDSQVIYFFNPEQLKNKGISATFGNNQYFDFALTYDLVNSNLFPIKTAIALPPDTAWQKIFLNRLDPLPETITLDEDGNWLANYQLSSKQAITVTATGSAQIFLTSRQDLPEINSDQLPKYLTSQSYWEVDNPKIKSLAEKLTTPEQIYSYVATNLIYDYGRLTENNSRFGAANALDNPESAICMEFTDLFIALSRAAGIPARAVNGYAYTANPTLRPLSLKKDVLHAWPEYYDSARKLWVQIDPTWSNTTGGIDFFNHFDLNHFAFAIQGLDSQFPAPAGSYKTDQSPAKQVAIDFGRPPQAYSQLEVSFNVPKQAVAGVTIPGQLIIRNQGNTAIYESTVSLKSVHFNLPQTEWLVPALLPFSSYAISFNLAGKNWLDQFTDTLTASVAGQTYSHQITLQPVSQLVFNQTNWPYIGLIAVALIALVFMVKLLYEKSLKRRAA